MIQVRCVVLSGKLNWKIASDAPAGPDETVRLSFHTADFFSLSERDAYERIRSALRRESVTWIEPALDGWRLDLDQLAKVIGRTEDLPWLKGSVAIRPQIEAGSQTAANQRIANVQFVFYLTAEAMPSTKTDEQDARQHVFISYSHHDKAWLDRLRVHLRPLVRDGLIDVFDDTKIKPGARWRDEIKAALDKARVAILLITADFLASDFIAQDELPPLLKKARAGGATILPVIVNACGFRREKKLSEYQAVNDPNKPLAALTPAESEQVFAAVAEAVEEALSRDGSKQEYERVDHTSDAILPDLPLQTMALLRLLARSKTGRFIMMSETQFAVDNALFYPADTRFFHDDVTTLVNLNAVTVDHISAGELMLRLNRRGAQLASMLAPPSEEEPNFVLPE
jgi:hypothetical protein